MLSIAHSTLLLNLLAHCGPSLKAVAEDRLVPELITTSLRIDVNSSSSSMTLTWRHNMHVREVTAVLKGISMGENEVFEHQTLCAVNSSVPEVQTQQVSCQWHNLSDDFVIYTNLSVYWQPSSESLGYSFPLRPTPFTPRTISNSCLTYRTNDTLAFNLTFVNQQYLKHPVTFYLIKPCGSLECGCFKLNRQKYSDPCSKEEDEVSKNCTDITTDVLDVESLEVGGLKPATQYRFKMTPYFCVDSKLFNGMVEEIGPFNTIVEKTINNSCLTYQSDDTLAFNLTFVNQQYLKHPVKFYLIEHCSALEWGCFKLNRQNYSDPCSKEEEEVSKNCTIIATDVLVVESLQVDDLKPATQYRFNMTPYFCVEGKLCNGMVEEIGPFNTSVEETRRLSILNDILNNDVKNKPIKVVVQNISEVLTSSSDTTASELKLVGEILPEVSKKRNISIPDVKDTLVLMSLAADKFQQTPGQANESNNFTNNMVVTMEQLTDNANLNGRTETTVDTGFLFLRLWELTDETTWKLGLELNEDLKNHSNIVEDVSTLTDRSIDTGILLPLENVRAIFTANINKTIILSTSIINDISIFRAGTRRHVDSINLRGVSNDLHAPTPTSVLNSRVIFMRLTVDGNPITDLSMYGDGHVRTLFTPLKKPEGAGPEETGQPTCVFWDVEMYNKYGGWSTRGCSLVSSSNGRYECRCNHLTNFALLMDYYQESVPTAHTRLLGLVSKILLGLSIGGLALTAFSFFLIKPLRKKIPQQTLFNLVIAMMTSLLIFLTGFENASSSKAACVAVGALLHYSILASFTWMLAMGILQYLMVAHAVRLKGALDKFTFWALIPAWGSPIVPVIAVLAYNMDLYYKPNAYCWLAIPALYYAFLGPVAVIVVINLVIYISVMHTVCRRREVSQGGVAYNVVSARASLGAFVCLGLSWTFAFMAIAEARVVFQYLFTISTALQGFLIFLLFTARERAVQDYWKKVFAPCWRRAPRGSRSSSYPLQSPGSRQVLKQPSSLSTPCNTEDTYEG